MKLALVGPQPIEVLKDMAIETFETISDTKISQNKDDDNNEKNRHESNDAYHRSIAESATETEIPETYPLQSNFLNKIIRIRPIQETRDMSVVWSMPSPKYLHDDGIIFNLF